MTTLIGTCRDVTEENRRREQIRLYEDIVHDVQIGLSVWTPSDSADPASLRLAAFNPAPEQIARLALTPYLGRIFAGFFTSKDPDRGTGLGLVTVHRFVTQSHGCIAAHSQPGRGTTVSLYFPVTRES